MKKIRNLFGRTLYGILSRQTFRVMKLTLFFSLLTVFQLYASDTYSQLTKVTLKLDNAKISDALEKIENQSEFYFLYSPKLIDVERKVSIAANNKTIKDVLATIFEGKAKFTVYDRQIILTPIEGSSASSLPLPQKITGTVTDSQTGETMPGVSVLIVGTKTGTLTDINGKYSIEIDDPTATLQFSFVGYNTFTQQVSGQTVINVQLVMLSTDLEGVVVVGYGTQKKSDVSGAIASVKVDALKRIATTQVSTAIQGSVAGVNVSSTSGDPSSSAKIKIRGTGSFNNTDPLYIIDGVPSDLSAVNPEDIETMDILKDASAAAIYGSRAGNGVIIITTKRGKQGETKFHFSSYYSINKINKKLPFVTNTADYIKVMKQAYDNAGQAYDGFITDYDANPSHYPGTDWQSQYFQTAPMQKYDLSISGGGSNYNFAISGGYAKQDGLVILTNNEKMSLRVNSDIKKKRLKVGESVSISRDKGRGRFEDSYSFYHLMAMSPLTPVYWDGSPSGYSAQNYKDGLLKDGNLIANLKFNNLSSDNIRLMASAYADYDILKNLKYTIRLSENIFDGYGSNFRSKFQNLYEADPTDTYDQQSLALLDENRSREYHNIFENYLNYNVSIEKHSIAAMAGYSQEKRDFRSTGGSVQDFPNNDLRVLDAGKASDNAYGYELNSRLMSYFGRFSYNYAEKYFIQGNVRRDGSSRFDVNNRWGVFPSISAAWRVDKESFFNVPLIKQFKLRASYGELGMQEIGDYQYMYNISSDIWSDLNYPFGPGPDQIIYVGSRAVSFPSIGIKWEGTKTTDFGMDFSMLNNKLSFEADYYMKKSEGILARVPIPLSTGSLDSPIVNAVSMNNNGFEFNVRYSEFEKAFKYQIGFVVSTYANKVTKMGYTGQEIAAGTVHWAYPLTTKTIVGQPMGSYFLYETSGIFHSQSEIDNYTWTDPATGIKAPIQPDAKPGDVRYIDANNDGTISGDDKKFLGSGQPKAEFGLNMSGSYKGFDAVMSFYSVIGKKMFNGSKWFLYDVGAYQGIHAISQDLVNAWRVDNPGSDIPRVVYQSQNNVLESDLFLENASYLRLRHLEFGYTFPEKLLKKVGIEGLRVYIAGDNILTFTKYTGYDPSIDGDDKLSRGVDRSPYPLPKQYLAGIQLDF